jgi:hypothetical protein
VAGEYTDRVTGVEIPEGDGGIITPRSEQLTIGAYSYSVYSALMAAGKLAFGMTIAIP